jgi:Cu/Ag efflux pump CusA
VIIGGLIASVVLTIFIVPAAYLIIYRRRETSPSPQTVVPQEAQ